MVKRSWKTSSSARWPCSANELDIDMLIPRLEPRMSSIGRTIMHPSLTLALSTGASLTFLSYGHSCVNSNEKPCCGHRISALHLPQRALRFDLRRSLRKEFIDILEQAQPKPSNCQ